MYPHKRREQPDLLDTLAGQNSALWHLARVWSDEAPSPQQSDIFFGSPVPTTALTFNCRVYFAKMLNPLLIAEENWRLNHSKIVQTFSNITFIVSRRIDNFLEVNVEFNFPR